MDLGPYHIYSISHDVYPITLFNDSTFRIEISNVIILPNPFFVQEFEEYIRSIPKWICILIYNFKTNPLSESLLYYIQNIIAAKMEQYSFVDLIQMFAKLRQCTLTEAKSTRALHLNYFSSHIPSTLKSQSKVKYKLLR